MKGNYSILILMLICLHCFGFGSFAGSKSQNFSAILAVNGSKSISKINSSNIILPVIPIDYNHVEVSGLLYLPDLQQYLAVSDETPHNTSLLFMMDRFGRIAREITIADLPEIIDMESITRDDNGTIYIACSSSANDNGEVLANRRLLVSLRQTGNEYILNQSVDLLTALSLCAAANPQMPWASFIRQAVTTGTMNIEGMFWHESSLCIGFKTPFFNNHSIILKIERVGELMAQQTLTADQITIWNQLDLINEDGRQELITDLFFENNILFITSALETNDSGDFSGSIWRFDPSSNALNRIIHYNDLKPEAIASASDSTALLIGFDQGSEATSQTMLIRGIR